MRDNDFGVEVRENDTVLVVSNRCEVEQLGAELCVVYKLAKELVVDDRCGEVDVISLTSKDVCDLGVTEEAVDAVVDVLHFNSSFLIRVMTIYAAFLQLILCIYYITF